MALLNYRSPMNPRNDVLVALARLPPKRRAEHTVKGTRFFFHILPSSFHDMSTLLSVV